jgi:hypothetical protein
LTTTPITSARPIATGKATAIPATSIAATISRFARLKTTPPTKAERSDAPFACCRSVRKPRPSLPRLPIDSPSASDVSTSPSA